MSFHSNLSESDDKHGNARHSFVNSNPVSRSIHYEDRARNLKWTVCVFACPYSAVTCGDSILCLALNQQVCTLWPESRSEYLPSPSFAFPNCLCCSYFQGREIKPHLQLTGSALNSVGKTFRALICQGLKKWFEEFQTRRLSQPSLHPTFPLFHFPFSRSNFNF